MLTLRPTCEHCEKDLPYNATDAMICSFECTFCRECVDTVLKNVCPNCSGGFAPRPIRPQRHLENNPASSQRVVKPVNLENHRKLCAQYEHVSPAYR